MSESPITTSSAVLTTENDHNVSEHTALLPNGPPADRPRRTSSVIGTTEHGYLIIPPPELLEDQIDPPKESRGILAILSVLLVGVFISNADGTLVIASAGNITSEFNDFERAGWLFTSFGLASCAAQPLYGKLSDIFGRKTVLQVAYSLFAIGGLTCGLGRSMNQVLLGRVIQGLGGAGMSVLVSILITDLVPLREVAMYRSYVNIVQTVGRSCGGPIGGALAQTIGWRWSFLSQAPLTAIAIILVAIKLDIKPKNTNNGAQAKTETVGDKLKRIDFFGAIFLISTILGVMLILDLGGNKISWKSPFMLILIATTILSGVLFYVVEKYWAKEPVFPLRLLSHKDITLSYTISIVQIASQMALMLFIPLYFQITKNASPAAAGAYMVPSVLGNTVGGLLTGAYITRTGRYKRAIVLASLSSMFCFTLLLLTWRGNTPVWQAFFVFFAGFGTGITQSAIFVDLNATVEEKDMAIASAGLYLSANLGGVSGVTAGATLFYAALRARLAQALADWPEGDEIAKEAVSNIEYVQKLTRPVHRLVVSAYVFAFRHAFTFSLIASSITFVLAIILKEKRLR